MFGATLTQLVFCRVKRVCFKTLVDEVQELEALSKDPGAVVHGKRYGGKLVIPPASLDKNESKNHQNKITAAWWKPGQGLAPRTKSCIQAKENCVT